MINFDNYINENKIERNKNWPYIPDHPLGILIIGGSESAKTNVLLNLIENQPDIDTIYLYAKDPHKAKYQCLIKLREKVDIDHHNDLELILSIQMICAMVTKILIITMPIKKTKY